MQLRAGGWGAAVALLNGAARALGTAAFTWYAWTLILRGEFTLGGFVALSAYLGYLTGPIGQLSGLFANFQQMAVTLGRTFDYLDATPEQDPTTAYGPAGAILRTACRRIEYNDVTFGYSQERPVLRDVSFILEPGSSTAIVGPSGAGKSTLLRLLVRMGQPMKGQILLDGAPISHFTLRDLRRQVAVVWQEVNLLKGTLWENLTFGLGDVPHDLVDEAVRICRLEALIRDLPRGYHTEVAEWGASLSGGQRQRIVLARALIRNAPIFLLDEATSQIDAETEGQILEDLFNSYRDRTIILVTHRLSTARLTDRILVLDAGRLGKLCTGCCVDGMHE